RVEPTRQAAAWFEEQLKTLRKDLEAAQERMTEYQRQRGIVSADERLDEEFSRLSALSAQYSRAQEQNVELKTREQLARQAIKSDALLDHLPEMRSDARIQKLNADLLDGEAALQALTAKYGDNHPEYRRQRAKNAALRKELNDEMHNVVATTTNLR